MASNTIVETPLAEGREVSLVFYSDSHPIAVTGTVKSVLPLRILTDNPVAGRLAKQRKVILVRVTGDDVQKTEAEVVHAEPQKDSWTLTISPERWEDIDRRRYPRYSVVLPVTLRAVAERDGNLVSEEILGETVDLSLGGALVIAKKSLPFGSLVEFQAFLAKGEVIRVLGITTHEVPGKSGLGIEFLDYVGGARYDLHTFLAEAA